jgi:Flp pilus assembly protein TadD
MWGLGFFVVALAFALYANVLSAPFVFDDDHGIVVNEQIRRISTSLSPTEVGSPLAGRPLVSLTFAVNYALGGLDPRGYRFVNVAIHILNALLLFAVARRHVDDGVACAIAVVWMVHPLATEPIDYVSQRTELMMAAFFLATVYFGGRDEVGGSSPSSPSRPSSLSRLTASVVCCALGMACKETMVVAPIVVILYDRTFTFGSFADAVRRRGSYYAALCATWLVLVALLWSAPRGNSAGFAGASVSPWEYLLNQGPMIVRYLRLAVWPRGLVLDYGEPLHVTLSQVAPDVAAIGALLAATGIAIIRWPSVGFLGAWFFLTLAPTSSIVPISTEVGAERRMYLPLMALVTLVMTTVVRGFDGSRIRLFRSSSLRAAAVATAVALLGIATYQRNAEYRSGVTLWQSVLDRWPPHARAHRNLAAELKLANRPDEEIEHLRAAVKDLPDIRNLLGVELLSRGRNAEAVDELQLYVRDHARDADAWANLGNALSADGRSTEALQAYLNAVDIDPGNGLSQRNLALQYFQQNDFADAVAHAREAVRLTPKDPAAHNLLGLALIGEQKIDEAIAEFRASLALQPDNNDASGYLERTLKAVGR